MSIKVVTPEIRWHAGPTGLNEAVMSLDFLHPLQSCASVAASSISKENTETSPTTAINSPISIDTSMESSNSSIDNVADESNKTKVAATVSPIILATAGADKEVKLWVVESTINDGNSLEFVFSLSGHDRTINCVRFSPDGRYLASASDDLSVILWHKPATASESWHWSTIKSYSDVSRTLLACGHKGDITDLAWSPDSRFLCSTSVDNSSVIWDVEKKETVERRKDHTQYVQGAAWDPLNEYLVTEGNDRSSRIYELRGFDRFAEINSKGKSKSRKCVCVQTLKTREYLLSSIKALTKISTATSEEPTDPPPPTTHRLFIDDTCPAFSRRPDWTPDGNYIIFPMGMYRDSYTSPTKNSVYAFARGNLNTPALHFSGQEKPSLGIRCHPHSFKVKNEGNFAQEHNRSVFAVITLDAIILYDTEQFHPICELKDIHYSDLTDVSWSSDGTILAVTSKDGYITFVQFSKDFFGTHIPRNEQLEINDAKRKRMFSTPKTTHKKRKLSEDGSDLTKTSSAKKKEKAPISVVNQAKSNDTSKPDSTAPKTVTILQVRKKKAKITPVLVSTTITQSQKQSSTNPSQPTTTNQNMKIATDVLAPPPPKDISYI